MSLARMVFFTIILLSSQHVTAAAKAPSASEAPKNAIEASTGVRYLVLQPALKGAEKINSDFFEYRLGAWTKNTAGKFVLKDSGVMRSSFKTLAQSSPALARAVLLSPLGESRRWWFSASGNASQTQIIDLAVLGNVDPAPAPSDVAAIPVSASKTASGLAYRVIKKGSRENNAHPTLQSTITIDYSGWTLDGKLFDSSVARGEKATFPLNGLIKGWQEGVQLMKVGDTYRFWIPGYLAYDGNPNPGTPKGILVFDVTLYGFEN